MVARLQAVRVPLQADMVFALANCRAPGRPHVVFFNDPATTEIYTVMNSLSLHDALPICFNVYRAMPAGGSFTKIGNTTSARSEEHTSELQSLITIPYAVFCLKKKRTNIGLVSNACVSHVASSTLTRQDV